MESFKSDLVKCYQTDRSAIVLMVINFLFAIGFCIFSIIRLNPNASVVKIGYGDIGGYRDGTWLDLLAFPILALCFGILHNFLALRIFRKRGSAMMKFFLLTTTALIVGALLVLIRISKEG